MKSPKENSNVGKEKNDVPSPSSDDSEEGALVVVEDIIWISDDLKETSESSKTETEPWDASEDGQQEAQSEAQEKRNKESDVEEKQVTPSTSLPSVIVRRQVPTCSRFYSNPSPIETKHYPSENSSMETDSEDGTVENSDDSSPREYVRRMLEESEHDHIQPGMGEYLWDAKFQHNCVESELIDLSNDDSSEAEIVEGSQRKQNEDKSDSDNAGSEEDIMPTLEKIGPEPYISEERSDTSWPELIKESELKANQNKFDHPNVIAGNSRPIESKVESDEQPKAQENEMPETVEITAHAIKDLPEPEACVESEGTLIGTILTGGSEPEATKEIADNSEKIIITTVVVTSESDDPVDIQVSVNLDDINARSDHSVAEMQKISEHNDQKPKDEPQKESSKQSTIEEKQKDSVTLISQHTPSTSQSVGKKDLSANQQILSTPQSFNQKDLPDTVENEDIVGDPLETLSISDDSTDTYSTSDTAETSTSVDSDDEQDEGETPAKRPRTCRFIS